MLSDMSASTRQPSARRATHENLLQLEVWLERLDEGLPDKVVSVPMSF